MASSMRRLPRRLHGVRFGGNAVRFHEHAHLGELPAITDATSTKWYLLTIFCVSAAHFVVSAKRALG